MVGLRRQEKGEGELTAAMRLLKELYWRNTRYCDVIVGDALYATAPFINAVSNRGKWVVARVKRDDCRVIVDAEGLFAQRGPDFEAKDVADFKGSRYDVRIWDEENFESWEGLKGTVRALRVEETRRLIQEGEAIDQTLTTHIATTCPKDQVKPLTVWRIMHARWGIENSVFHQAKTYCSFEHNYIHHEVATEVAWILQVIAFNLLMFYSREGSQALGELVEMLIIGLATLGEPVLLRPG